MRVRGFAGGGRRCVPDGRGGVRRRAGGRAVQHRSGWRRARCGGAAGACGGSIHPVTLGGWELAGESRERACAVCAHAHAWRRRRRRGWQRRGRWRWWWRRRWRRWRRLRGYCGIARARVRRTAHCAFAGRRERHSGRHPGAAPCAARGRRSTRRVGAARGVPRRCIHGGGGAHDAAPGVCDGGRCRARARRGRGEHRAPALVCVHTRSAAQIGLQLDASRSRIARATSALEACRRELSEARGGTVGGESVGVALTRVRAQTTAAAAAAQERCAKLQEVAERSLAAAKGLERCAGVRHACCVCVGGGDGADHAGGRLEVDRAAASGAADAQFDSHVMGACASSERGCRARRPRAQESNKIASNQVKCPQTSARCSRPRRRRSRRCRRASQNCVRSSRWVVDVSVRAGGSRGPFAAQVAAGARDDALARAGALERSLDVTRAQLEVRVGRGLGARETVARVPRTGRTE